MRFLRLQIGRSKEKNGKEKVAVKEPASTRVVEIEEHLNGRANALKQTARQLKKLSDKVSKPVESDDVTPKPHGPIGVLEVVEENAPIGGDLIRESDTAEPLEEDSEQIKLVEVSAKAATSIKSEAAPPSKAEATAPPKEEKKPPEEAADSLNKLFSQDEEEENPLANLIRSLPNVTAEELIEDLNEIKAIIKDWEKK
jgi:hypothetical protein